jgi:hypothetical protein
MIGSTLQSQELHHLMPPNAQAQVINPKGTAATQVQVVNKKA